MIYILTIIIKINKMDMKVEEGENKKERKTPLDYLFIINQYN